MLGANEKRLLGDRDSLTDSEFCSEWMAPSPLTLHHCGAKESLLLSDGTPSIHQTALIEPPPILYHHQKIQTKAKTGSLTGLHRNQLSAQSTKLVCYSDGQERILQRDNFRTVALIAQIGQASCYGKQETKGVRAVLSLLSI